MYNELPNLSIDSSNHCNDQIFFFLSAMVHFVNTVRVISVVTNTGKFTVLGAGKDV